jgi:hypothetical protein
MSDNGDERDLTPHRLTPPCGANSVPDQVLTTIVGYVGAGRTNEHARVYLNLAMTSYYEVEVADVVRTQQIDREDPDSPRRLWIKAEAPVRVVHVDQMNGSASFVQGEMRKKYASRFGTDPINEVGRLTDVFNSLLCISVPGTTTGTWPCAGTDVWPQCPDCL